MRELEKQIANKKREIASFKQGKSLNVVDKFTNIDEILLELVKRQETTNELLVLQARILFAFLKAQSGGVVPQIEGIEDIAGSKYTTKIFRVDNVKFSILNRDEMIFKLEGSGIISEIELVSANTTVNNKNYKARVVNDDKVAYNDSWDNFNSRTMHEADMTAYNDDIANKYVLLFQDICYDDYCSLEVYESYADFDYINVKYHEKISIL